MTLVLVTGVGGARGAAALAAALAVELGRAEGAALLLDLGVASGRRRPTLLAAEEARRIEAAIADSLPELSPAARGHACHVCLPPEPASLDGAAAALGTVPQRAACVVHLPERLWRGGVDGLDPGAAMLRADLARERSLAALAVRDLRRRGVRVKVAKRPLPWAASRRALAGVRIGGAAERGVERAARRLLRSGERAQALPALLGSIAALLIAALALVAIAGALTGKGRVQRAADLAALSAVRSMRDDLPRLLAPARLPNGAPNPAHIAKREYLRAARLAAIDAGGANGVAARRMRVVFPDRASFAPLRARVRVLARAELGGSRDSVDVAATATAEAAPPALGAGDFPSHGSGGGYSGPLVYRNGEGMRPDVAAAFDRMAAAAARDGVTLVVASGFRSDEEQAALFSQNPDPRWVAPPGKSLHRCASELDLGPREAYPWLAANATRFGFVQRYSWEPWHFGLQ